MSAPTIIALLANVVHYLTNTPLIGGGENEIWSLAGSNVLGANRAGDDDETKYARLASDGTQVAFTMPTGLDALPAGTGGALVLLDYIEVVVLRTDSGGVKTPLTRILDSGTPTGDQWTRNSDTELEIAAALPAGQIIEVYIAETVDTITGGALTAGREYNTPAYDFMVADALTNLRGLTR